MLICVEHCVTGRIKLIDTSVKDWEIAFDMSDYPMKRTELIAITMSAKFQGKTVQHEELIAYEYCIKHLTGKQ